MLYCVNIIPRGYHYRLFMLNTFHLKDSINAVASRLMSSGRKRDSICRERKVRWGEQHENKVLGGWGATLGGRTGRAVFS